MQMGGDLAEYSSVFGQRRRVGTVSMSRIEGKPLHGMIWTLVSGQTRFVGVSPWRNDEVPIAERCKLDHNSRILGPIAVNGGAFEPPQ